MEIKFELATEPAVKGTIAVVACVSIAYIATHSESPYGFASSFLIEIIGVNGTLTHTPPQVGFEIPPRMRILPKKPKGKPLPFAHDMAENFRLAVGLPAGRLVGRRAVHHEVDTSSVKNKMN